MRNVIRKIKRHLRRSKYEMPSVGRFEFLPSNEYKKHAYCYAPIDLQNIKMEYTTIIPLEKDEDIIMMGFDKETRYEIRRAEKQDLFKYEHYMNPTEQTILEFIEVYRRFMTQKQLNVESVDTFYKLELLLRGSNGILQISRMKSEEDEIDIWHVYTEEAPGRMRLTCSASLYRDSNPTIKFKNGRLNRLLHWKDICEFKKQKYELYDLGGVDLESEELKSIARFKMSFSSLGEKRYSETDESIQKDCINIVCPQKDYEFVAHELVNQYSDKYKVSICLSGGGGGIYSFLRI